ncbi:oligosaccharide flippase family protein [Desulfococcaceae bacterium HSG7]|nr:oligosaccharide flippase family protein [Desulfococcaceae bacterium HSG7]
MIDTTLGKLAAKGAVFLAVLTFVKKFLGIVRNVVLARLLTPEDFGLMALAMVLIEGMYSLTNVNILKYLIQKKNIDDTTIGNAWFLNIVRGLLLTFLALSLCPLYSRLLKEPSTLQVLWIVAFIPMLEGLKNPGSILAEREIQFGRISTYETICTILEVAVVVLVAFIIRDVKALAWGLLFGVFIKSLLSYFLFTIPGKPKFDVPHQIEILSVAKHFAFISAGTLIMTQGDNLIVGALQGSEQLGLYVIAYQLAVFPVQFLQQIASRVAMPVFSSLQIQKDRLRSMVGNLMQMQMAIIIPFVIVMGVFSHDLITTLYGDKWSACSPILQVLMLVTLGKGVTHVCVPYIVGTGAFSFASRMKLAETVLFLIVVYLGTRYFGLMGAALGAGTGYMAAGIGRLIYMCRKSNIKFLRVSRYTLIPVMAVLPGILAANFMANTVTWHRNIETVTILTITCVSYAGFSLLLQRNLADVFFRKILSKTGS